jgi:L-ribulose-5-phosphate 3-epimerase
MLLVKLGVRLESFLSPLRQALSQSERLGVAGVQVNSVGDLSPKNLSHTGRREFSHLLRSYNLELAALFCPLRHGLNHPDGLDARIEHIERVMSLSFDLGARLVVIEVGPLPRETDPPTGNPLKESLLALGRHGDRVGAVLALTTGLEPGDVLADFLSRFDTGGLGISFNPANLLLNGFDPETSLLALEKQIVYFEAKDARPGSVGRAAQEVPLGHGHIDWMQMIETLKEIGYHGWLTVSQDIGENRASNIASSVQFMRRLLG